MTSTLSSTLPMLSGNKLILFYFSLFYFILFYFILFYFILFLFCKMTWPCLHGPFLGLALGAEDKLKVLCCDSLKFCQSVNTFCILLKAIFLFV
jgi:hypothetical protein